MNKVLEWLKNNFDNVEPLTVAGKTFFRTNNYFIRVGKEKNLSTWKYNPRLFFDPLWTYYDFFNYFANQSVSTLLHPYNIIKVPDILELEIENCLHE
jgi:hypothetical protein